LGRTYIGSAAETGRNRWPGPFVHTLAR